MSERKQGGYAADDFAEIRKYLTWIPDWLGKPETPVQQATPMTDRSKCAVQAGRPGDVSSCWCYHSDPDGSSYMCPHRSFDDGA